MELNIPSVVGNCCLNIFPQYSSFPEITTTIRCSWSRICATETHYPSHWIVVACRQMSGFEHS